MKREYFLTSEHLGFGYWSEDDLPLAMELWGDPRVTARIGGPFTAEQVRARLDREIACRRDHGMQYWPVFLLDTGAHAGCAGLRPYRPEERIYELGFHLRPEHWGRGLAEEAGRAVIGYGFAALGAVALFAGHHPENLASSRVLAKLGFHYTHEELYPADGLMHPSYLLKNVAPGRARSRQCNAPGS